MSKKTGRGVGVESTSRSTVMLFSFGLLITLVLAIMTFIHVYSWQSNAEVYLQRTGESRVVSQEVANNAVAAATGDKEAFDRLRSARDRMDVLIIELKQGVPARNVPPSPKEVIRELTTLETHEEELEQSADDILSSKDEILTVQEFISTIAGYVPELERLSTNVVDILVANGASADQVAIASRQLMLSERINKNVNNVLSGGQKTAEAIDKFSRDTEYYGRVLAGMLEGNSAMGINKITMPEAVGKLKEVAMLFSTIKDHADQIIETIPAVLPAMEAASKVTVLSGRVNESASKLLEAYGKGPGLIRVAGIQAGPVMLTILGVIAVLMLVMLGSSMLKASRSREEQTKQLNERNQQAILRLLDEMGDLADGDLTVTATVTEDVTGAIADSINFAIEALRSLVTTINQISHQVSMSAQESRATAMHLAEASDHQAEQITSASEAIRSMTLAMEQMSSGAAESAEVAHYSVEIAGKGAGAVQRTIRGMDTIREQIQETSKRIKRLGESSQEIGDIVELIDDIADQTNILALNAAMQAAMAGEAGRGFAVVADEVQRLAERSGNATKQIEALVKTIQADTNEAVSSMENTTSEVVAGAQLAEDAGEALSEIENVSNQIADRIRLVSASAAQQASEAVKINDTMSVIQEITTQTSDGTNQTAASIGTLADMADELQRSVSDFRLPESA